MQWSRLAGDSRKLEGRIFAASISTAFVAPVLLTRPVGQLAALHADKRQLGTPLQSVGLNVILLRAIFLQLTLLKY